MWRQSGAAMASTVIGQRAVVIGAGIAGLSAARALSDHFEQVVVLERDPLPDGPAHRPGTPQSRHAHGLLVGGERALSALFPGFERDLVDAGAAIVRSGIDTRIERVGYDLFPRRDLGLISYALSRPATEFAVRQGLRSQANVTLRDRCRVGRLSLSADGRAVTGVHFEDDAAGAQELATDLIVDASGLGGPTLATLKAAGLALPEETVIGVDQRYTTGVFHIPDDAPDDWTSVLTFGGQPPNIHRGGLLWPIEGDRWIVSLGGRHDDAPGAGLDGFMAFARTLRTPTIYDAVRNARPDGEAVRFGFRDNVLRHFERLATFPRGLIPIGDAICRFNPVYGQGMSVAAQEAVLLRELLAARASGDDPLKELARDYFEKIPALVETPWNVATFDFMHPQTRGHRPDDFETRVRFAAAFTRLCAEDPDVHRLSAEVNHLLKPRSVLRDPALVQRLLPLLAQG
jgi:2-polyprenyl-6-methoxyphenol hydroxylase-like FAD-dependent oxidoreductase